MIPDFTPGIALAIQFAVAPALLLVGVGGILNVVAVRLARVVDRARALERHVPDAEGPLREQEITELRVLDRRMRICHASVGLCTASGLLICLVVALLFVNSMMNRGYDDLVSVLFVLAMVALSMGLVLFLTEITIAIRVVRVSDAFLDRGSRRKGGHD
ncbi:MAG: hypothetical protein JWL74_1845 [Alphaproteobacteria bacterium]|jgi:ribosomal protein S28E/S33|nr:hypothetical protein [Alphaproteobacteria bacterium]